LSSILIEVATEACKDELTDHAVYKKLSESRFERNSEFRRILAKLAETEYEHHEFWKKYIPEKEIRVDKTRLYVAIFLRLMLGTTFVVRYLERNEIQTIDKYKSISRLIPSEDKNRFEKILHDEEEHEKEFESKIQGSMIQYISFIILGLADAVVEIAGIHAGSLGIYNSTRIAGLAGIIAGAAASLAMSSAAYAQAKQGFQVSARLSATYTGFSYFATALVLASPYFFTEDMTLALIISMMLAIVLIAFITFYSSIIAGKPFKGDFIEITAVMFGATVALYALGITIRYFFGITI
jgi:VIT1/CCC1 family predicted Fe2+/Mn2+ transporter